MKTIQIMAVKNSKNGDCERADRPAEADFYTVYIGTPGAFEALEDFDTYEEAVSFAYQMMRELGEPVSVVDDVLQSAGDLFEEVLDRHGGEESVEAKEKAAMALKEAGYTHSILFHNGYLQIDDVVRLSHRLYGLSPKEIALEYVRRFGEEDVPYLAFALLSPQGLGLSNEAAFHVLIDDDGLGLNALDTARALYDPDGGNFSVSETLELIREGFGFSDRELVELSYDALFNPACIINGLAELGMSPGKIAELVDGYSHMSEEQRYESKVAFNEKFKMDFDQALRS